MTSNYRAYLMRLWRDGEHQPWRALLEDPHSNEQYGFANLEQLFTFLREQTQDQHSAGDKDESQKTI